MGHGYTLQPTENGIKKGKNNLTHNMLINIIISFTIFDKGSIIRVGTKKEPQVLEHSRFKNVTSFKRLPTDFKTCFI